MNAEIDELIMAALCVSLIVSALGWAAWALATDRKVGE